MIKTLNACISKRITRDLDVETVRARINENLCTDGEPFGLHSVQDVPVRRVIHSWIACGIRIGMEGATIVRSRHCSGAISEIANCECYSY